MQGYSGVGSFGVTIDANTFISSRVKQMLTDETTKLETAYLKEGRLYITVKTAEAFPPFKMGIIFLGPEQFQPLFRKL